MAGVTIFFPLFSVFLAVITNFTMGISFGGVVSTISWMSGTFSRLRGFNPMVVTSVAHVPTRGTRYQNGIAKDMFRVNYYVAYGKKW